MAYVNDLEAAKESIGRLKCILEAERAFTMKQIEMLRAGGLLSESREIAHWDDFRNRTSTLEREIDAMTRIVTDYMSAKGPDPLVINR